METEDSLEQSSKSLIEQIFNLLLPVVLIIIMMVQLIAIFLGEESPLNSFNNFINLSIIIIEFFAFDLLFLSDGEHNDMLKLYAIGGVLVVLPKVINWDSSGIILFLAGTAAIFFLIFGVFWLRQNVRFLGFQALLLGFEGAALTVIEIDFAENSLFWPVIYLIFIYFAAMASFVVIGKILGQRF